MIQIDMEMPENCIDCPLIAEEYTGAGVYECVWLQKRCLRNQRRKDCPLIEVEDPWLDLQKKLERWMAEKRIKFYSIDDEDLDTDDIKRGVEG